MKDDIQKFEKAAADFIEIVKVIPLSKPIYKDGWNAKQIISHVIFYQTYYASIVRALVRGESLPLITESLAQVNISSARQFASSSRKRLLDAFSQAQQLFVLNIREIAPNKNIPYKKGGRVYTATRYLLEITRHLVKHTADLL